MSSSKSVLNDYVAGAVGGCAGLVVGHPFDTTKVQLQTQHSSAYKGTWDAISKIGKHGPAQFFRGLGFPLASYGLINSVFFGVYGSSIHYMTQGISKPTYSQIFAAGCLGGTVQLAVACPVDVVKVVLQSQLPSAKQKGNYFRGPVQCARSILQQKGPLGLYRGLPIMLPRDGPTYGIYMITYEWMNDVLRDQWALTGFTACAISGGIAGSTCWFCAMPFDVLKSKQQAAVLNEQPLSVRQLVRSIYRKQGVRGFYTGCLVTCARAFPVNAITLAVYTECLRLLNNRQSSGSAIAETNI